MGRIRGSKTAGCDGQVRICDVVYLRIVYVLSHRPAVRPTFRRALKLPLEFRARLDQPAIAQGNQQHRIDLRVEEIVPAADKAECTEVTGQDGNWLVTLLNLRGRFQRKKEQTQARETQNSLLPARKLGFSE